MYSSKYNFTSFPEKLTLKFLGKLEVKIGASVSCSPPVIVPLFAQPNKIIATINKKYLLGILNIN
jgi:hypothetical protein